MKVNSFRLTDGNDSRGFGTRSDTADGDGNDAGVISEVINSCC